MANKDCGIIPHPPCATCGVTVFRIGTHTHKYVRRKLESVLCGECDAIIGAAAIPIMSAAGRVGVPCTLAGIQDWIRQGHVGVLVDVELPVDG